MSNPTSPSARPTLSRFRPGRRRRERLHWLWALPISGVPLAVGVLILFARWNVYGPRIDMDAQQWRDLTMSLFAEPSGIAPSGITFDRGYWLVGVDDEREGVFLLKTLTRDTVRTGCLLPYRHRTEMYVQGFLPFPEKFETKDLEAISFDPESEWYYVLGSHRDTKKTRVLLRFKIDDIHGNTGGRRTLRIPSVDTIAPSPEALLGAINKVMKDNGSSDSILLTRWQKGEGAPWPLELEGLAARSDNLLYLGVKRPHAGRDAILLEYRRDDTSTRLQAKLLRIDGLGIRDLFYDRQTDSLFILAYPDERELIGRAHDRSDTSRVSQSRLYVVSKAALDRGPVVAYERSQPLPGVAGIAEGIAILSRGASREMIIASEGLGDGSTGDEPGGAALQAFAYPSALAGRDTKILDRIKACWAREESPDSRSRNKAPRASRTSTTTPP